jgi:hypothetical protein
MEITGGTEPSGKTAELACPQAPNYLPMGITGGMAIGGEQNRAHKPQPHRRG